MTLRVIDGFDYFPAAGLTEAQLSAAGYYWHTGFDIFPIVQPGRFSFGNCIGFNQGNTNRAPWFLKLTGVSVATGVMGFAFKWHPSNTNVFVTFYDAVNDTPNISISFHPLGVIKVWKGFVPPGSGTLLATSDPGAFVQEQWFYCEIKATIDSVSGSVTVRVNTVDVITLPTANTNGGGRSIVDSIGFGVINGGAFQYYIDDLYFCDTAGAANNNFLGNCRVWTQFTTGNGPHIDFTAVGAGSNWQAVQNTAIDDTKYVYSGATGAYDLYDIQTIVNSPSIFGVQVRGAYRQDTATQLVAHNVIKSGSTQAEGSDHYTNQTYTYYMDIWETNPNTGVGFLDTEVNALLIGPKRVSP